MKDWIPVLRYPFNSCLLSRFGDGYVGSMLELFSISLAELLRREMMVVIQWKGQEGLVHSLCPPLE